MTDYDIGRLVEVASTMQLADERKERVRQLRSAARVLDAQLTNGEARKEVIEIAVQAGVPEEYAEKALERLYPHPEKLEKLEKAFLVQPTEFSVERENREEHLKFLRGLYRALAFNFPELRIMEGVPNLVGSIVTFIDLCTLNNRGYYIKKTKPKIVEFNDLISRIEYPLWQWDDHSHPTFLIYISKSEGKRRYINYAMLRFILNKTHPNYNYQPKDKLKRMKRNEKDIIIDLFSPEIIELVGGEMMHLRNTTVTELNKFY